MSVKIPLLPSVWRAITLACLVVLPQVLPAEEPGVPLEPNSLSYRDPNLLAQAKALKDQGKLMSKEQLIAAVKAPKPEALNLPPVQTERLEPRIIAERARRGLMRVGWYYRCPDCHQMHVELSGGYAITADGVVVTCWHCIAPEKQDAKQAYLVAYGADRQIHAVTAVLACDKALDAAILRVDGTGFAPLPINDHAQVGDAVYVFSDPLEISGYFSTGMINRFFWLDDREHPDADTLDSMRKLRVNVSTDWAPGSSGAAVVDACGNVVCHVEAIDALSPDGESQVSGKRNSSSGGTVMVVHDAVPVRGVSLLIEAMRHPAPVEVKTTSVVAHREARKSE